MGDSELCKRPTKRIFHRDVLAQTIRSGKGALSWKIAGNRRRKGTHPGGQIGAENGPTVAAGLPPKN